MIKDFIIVGLGFAGISISHLLERNGKAFIVFDDNSQKSTQTSGALYNPVILKRFTPVWKSEKQLESLKRTFEEIEEKLNAKFNISMPVYRKFASTEEQNNWFSASDKPHLSPFMIPKVLKNEYPYVKADYGFGEVAHTGRIDTKLLLELYIQYLEKDSLLKKETFDYSQLQIHSDYIEYKGIKSKNIVFCEGYGVVKNPYFNYLPMNGCKGEVLTIKATNLKLDAVVKGNGFIIPMNDDLYKVGSTYQWDDYSPETTEKAREVLLEKLHTLIDCDYEVVGQESAIRPTVKDRRPLVGVHPKHSSLYILNGLGTRGSMIAPYTAESLYEFIFSEKELDNEMNIERYESLFSEEDLTASSR